MVEAEPAVFFLIEFEILIFAFNYFQREIVIGHDPEWISVGMGGVEITEMY